MTRQRTSKSKRPRPGGGPADERAPSSTGRSTLDWAILIAAVPLTLAAVRVAVFSQGDTAAFLTLLRTLNVPTVVVSTIVQAFPTIFAFGVLVLYVMPEERAVAGEWMRRHLWLGVFVVLLVPSGLALMRPHQVVTFSIALLAVLAHWLWRRAARRHQAVNAVSSLTQRQRLTWLAVAAAILLLGPMATGAGWLPHENIEQRGGESVSGYVLETSDGWVTVMTPARSVEIVHASTIESRVVCYDHWTGSVMDLLSREDASERPRCDEEHWETPDERP